MLGHAGIPRDGQLLCPIECNFMRAAKAVIIGSKRACHRGSEAQRKSPAGDPRISDGASCFFWCICHLSGSNQQALLRLVVAAMAQQ